MPVPGGGLVGMASKILTQKEVPMKKSMAYILSASIFLSGCVSQQSMDRLSALQAQCAAGDRNACIAAQYQAQANQQEQNTNAAIAAGVGAALIGAAAIGAAAADRGPRGPGPGGPGFGPGRPPPRGPGPMPGPRP